MKTVSRAKVCFADHGLFLPFAQRLARDFGEVSYWCPSTEDLFPTPNRAMVGEGLPGIRRVLDLYRAIKECDLVVCPDVFQAPLVGLCRELGKPVWGAGESEELELDRWYGKQLLKTAGLPYNPTIELTGIAALRKYVQTHPDKVVKLSRWRGVSETFRYKNYDLIQPKIDEMAYKLGPFQEMMKFYVENVIESVTEPGMDTFTVDGQFPKNTVCGYEVKDKAYIGAVMPYESIYPGLRAINTALAPTFKRDKYRGFFSTEARVSKDHKCYPIDLTCFSADTEVLTSEGWKLFSSLSGSEKICTLNPVNRVIEYQPILNQTAYWFDGEMVLISNKERGLELLVTPNHSVWASRRTKDAVLKEYRADSLISGLMIPRTGLWVGLEPEFHAVPAYSNTWRSGKNNTRVYDRDSVRIPIRDWLKFLAIFLSEGFVHNGYQVHLTQTKFKDAFREILSALPFKFTESADTFTISDVQLSKHLEGFGPRNVRGIPSYVKHLSAGLIQIFLDAYVLGDGTTARAGRGRLASTTSARTANDLQELFLKAGSCANIKVVTEKGSPVKISNGKYTTKHDALQIRELPVQNAFYLDGQSTSRGKKYITNVPYSGMVYDIEVPNHVLYVRRKGKPCWSGNCRHPTPAGEPSHELIKNLGDIVWAAANGIMVEPVYAGKFAAQIMLTSGWAEQDVQPVFFPEKIANSVKLYNACAVDGQTYIIPQDNAHLKEIGSVVGIGDTLQQAIDKCKEYAEQVEGYLIECDAKDLDEATHVIDEGQKAGVTFGSEQRKIKAA